MSFFYLLVAVECNIQSQKHFIEAGGVSCSALSESALRQNQHLLMLQLHWRLASMDEPSSPLQGTQ
jgi:hypothetical protein